MELILENVRCFAERQSIPVKPLTLLVGENSAGKSTFLACLSAVSDPYTFPTRPRFNVPPYNLGNYDTIATQLDAEDEYAKSFELGYTNQHSKERIKWEIVATYQDNKGLIQLSQIEFARDTFKINISLPGSDEDNIVYTFSKDNVTRVYDTVYPMLGMRRQMYGLDELFLYVPLVKRQANGKPGERIVHGIERIVPGIETLFRQKSLLRTLSVAPIRTKPRRTYDEVIEEFSPEGEHVPFVLDELLQSQEKRAILERFGQESGLFSHLVVKKLGTKLSDPIQVMVTSEGRPASSAANLVDVGYGVSQALPLVVQMVLAAPQSRLLLQQPEVHLHPRAQAALGTLFVDLLASSNKQFVVETHSDYILDRVRQEVARGRVAAEDVGILYFEREKNGTHIHPIALDDQGNITNAPPSYRAFFLQEELSLLTRANFNGGLK